MKRVERERRVDINVSTRVSRSFETHGEEFEALIYEVRSRRKRKKNN